MKVEQVFIPNGTPSVTYVDRKDLRLEDRLQDYFNLEKIVVLVSGPSKSGKTVLVNKVTHDKNVVPVFGAGLKTADELWDRALQRFGVAPTASKTSTNSKEGKAGISGEAGVSILGFGAKVRPNASAGVANSKSETENIVRNGLTGAIEVFANSRNILFIDDFHYIDQQIQEEVGRQIKVASDNGVKIIVASVPHRSGDVVKSNSELRGRVASIDFSYWGRGHLKEIVDKGFAQLNILVTNDVVERLISESMGSPQLMQTICFSLCRVLKVSETLKSLTRYVISEEDISVALSNTTAFADFGDQLVKFHAGPRVRGQDRKEYQFIDGSKGDVYRAVLLAMKEDPINMSFSYDNIYERVRSVCVSESPSGSSISTSLQHMSLIAEEMSPQKPAIYWDEDRLEIVDPYFGFYLRCSNKLSEVSA